MRRSFIFTLIMSFALSFACSSGNKPSNKDLELSFVNYLPAYLIVKEFSVEATQNVGDKVNPIIKTRFNATITPSTNLYKLDKKENEVNFIRQSFLSGNRTNIFGVISSNLYQGSWRHNFNIDGNPIVNLGKPHNNFSGTRIIIRGSTEEQEYYAEIKKKEEERILEQEKKAADLRENISNASKLLVGTWRGKDYLAIYNSDGTFQAKLDDGQESMGKLDFENDVIFYKFTKWKGKDGKWNVKDGVNKSRIIFLDQNNITCKGLRSGDIWKETRIK